MRRERITAVDDEYLYLPECVDYRIAIGTTTCHNCGMLCDGGGECQRCGCNDPLDTGENCHKCGCATDDLNQCPSMRCGDNTCRTWVP